MVLLYSTTVLEGAVLDELPSESQLAVVLVLMVLLYSMTVLEGAVLNETPSESQSDVVQVLMTLPYSTIVSQGAVLDETPSDSQLAVVLDLMVLLYSTTVLEEAVLADMLSDSQSLVVPVLMVLPCSTTEGAILDQAPSDSQLVVALVLTSLSCSMTVWQGAALAGTSEFSVAYSACFVDEVNRLRTGQMKSLQPPLQVGTGYPGEDFPVAPSQCGEKVVEELTVVMVKDAGGLALCHPEDNTFIHHNNSNNEFISIALFHVKHAQLC